MIHLLEGRLCREKHTQIIPQKNYTRTDWFRMQILAQPCHVWKPLWALRGDPIPEAACATITPAGSEGNLIERMQMKDVFKIPLHRGGGCLLAPATTAPCVSSPPVVLVLVV